jgi:hypothetical protein
MRAVRCWCEELIVAHDDEALADTLREHVAEMHPEDGRGDEEIRARVEAEAYDPPDRPPWAY